MGRKKKFKNLVALSIFIEKEDKDKLESKGYKFSSFFRQAQKAEEKGSWQYNHKELGE